MAVEKLLDEIERLRLNEVVLRRVLADRDEEIERLQEKLYAAELALRAESTRSEPHRGELRSLVRWLGNALAVALASGAASYGAVLAAPPAEPSPSEMIVVMSEDPELEPLATALDQLNRYCLEVQPLAE
jgi:hypothetical protein